MTREIVVFRYITELLLLYPLFTMHAAAPDGTPPRRIGDEKIKKNSLSAVSQRDPEVGVLPGKYDFHGSGVNRIDACRVLPSCFFLLCFFFSRRAIPGNKSRL
jgi:hypothetical protein